MRVNEFHLFSKDDITIEYGEDEVPRSDKDRLSYSDFDSLNAKQK